MIELNDLDFLLDDPKVLAGKLTRAVIENDVTAKEFAPVLTKACRRPGVLEALRAFRFLREVWGPYFKAARIKVRRAGQMWLEVV